MCTYLWPLKGPVGSVDEIANYFLDSAESTRSYSWASSWPILARNCSCRRWRSWWDSSCQDTGTDWQGGETPAFSSEEAEDEQPPVGPGGVEGERVGSEECSFGIFPCTFIVAVFRLFLVRKTGCNWQIVGMEALLYLPMAQPVIWADILRFWFISKIGQVATWHNPIFTSKT